MESRTENMKPSGLRPPSQYSAAVPSSTTMGLQEMTDSESNARSRTVAAAQGMKRAYTGPTTQPEAKRKTLAERAGEPIAANKPSIPPPTVTASSLIRPAIKGTSIANLAGSHAQAPTATTASSRYAPTSRPPVTNFSQTLGPGSRPPPTNARPGTSMGNNFGQSTYGRPRATTRSRPVTAMGDRGIEGEVVQGQQQPNGTKLSSSLRFSVRRPVRRSVSLDSLLQPSERPRDELGLSKAMANLSVDDAVGEPPKGGQVITKREQQMSLHPRGAGTKGGVVVNWREQKQLWGQVKSASPSQPKTPNREKTAAQPKTPCPDKNLEVEFEKLGTAIKSARRLRNSPTKSPSPTKLPYLTKDSNLTSFTGWDVDERLDGIESQFKAMKEAMTTSLSDRKTLEDAVDMAKTRVVNPQTVSDLEREKQKLDNRNVQLQGELDSLQRQVVQLTLDLEGEQRKHKYNVEDMSREHRQALDELRRELKDETDRMQRTHREELEALERHYRAEMEDERSQKSRELQELRARLGAEQQDLSLAILGKEREIQDMRSQLESVKSDLDREQTIKGGLQKQIAEMSTTAMTLEDRNRALRAQIDFLESDSKQQSDSFAAMEARLQDALRIAEEARQKLIKEETERRILFNKYQELKGNIRVMCRVRPVLNESEGNQALIAFPDLKTSAQIDVTGPEERSSLGHTIRKVIPFEFDRVFTPAIHNEEIFGEISQLVQSALDGFNVCIFCYGQTGSGKTYTMSSSDGMIPRATHMIYETVTKLKEKSWTYTMEGSFVEVYNEELNDLLTPNTEQKRKLEIRHDDARKQTTVLNCKTVALDSPNTVESILQQAQNNRSVAATKANERSSRSHSVFILKLVGENSATNERCEGTLNLVDLAGSERLKHSQAEGDRMKETQNINKSLACLGDVIEALGRGSGHIPYRNSKLTHLLQYSLGGNSKTLMFVMVSPLEAHLKETITSLRFATKVHNTHIGTAKSTKKTKERISDC
ncbi:P-loop containing nucleoside triphosphate hydrolase protein [Immersiella caudata]|uniref:Kinesin-like protein n=1 Tax=Immersiella caudata TaxID=314043 RepID=A0AA39WPS1_9PEZI|nr:P-loop containing nucleoside triphosphate hydrolase protein [Immersiella caudata]